MAKRPPVVQVQNVTRGTAIGSQIAVAQTFMSRFRGLMLVRELAAGSGLLIDPCTSIHMFCMRIPLDVLYLDKQDRVVRAQEGIRPWRIGPLFTAHARYVIELPVGTIACSKTAVGDQFQIVDAATAQANATPQ